MADPSVTRERIAHALAAELAERGLNVHRVDAIGVTVLSVEQAVSVWVDENAVRWRVGDDLEKWESHPHDDLALVAERVLAYVCGQTGARP